eukprot:4926836-Prymnesium_polylepis.2
MQLRELALASNKFAASQAGSPCNMVFGRGNSSRPFDTLTCTNKFGPCFLWCDCENHLKVNSTRCKAESESAFALRTTPLVPKEYRCVRRTARSNATSNLSTAAGEEEDIMFLDEETAPPPAAAGEKGPLRRWAPFAAAILLSAFMLAVVAGLELVSRRGPLLTPSVQG